MLLDIFEQLHCSTTSRMDYHGQSIPPNFIVFRVKTSRFNEGGEAKQIENQTLNIELTKFAIDYISTAFVRRSVQVLAA